MDDKVELVALSDLHLGTQGRLWRYIRAAELIAWGNQHSATICLAGDILEGSPYNTLDRSRVTIHKHGQELLRQLRIASDEGRLHALPGNHDEWLCQQILESVLGVRAEIHDKLAFFEKLGCVVHHGHALDFRHKLDPVVIANRLEFAAATQTEISERKEAMEHFLSNDEDLLHANEALHRASFIGAWSFMELVALPMRLLQGLSHGDVDDWATNWLEARTIKSYLKSNAEHFAKLEKLYDELTSGKIDSKRHDKVLAQINKLKRELWSDALQRDTLLAEVFARQLGAYASFSGHTHARFLTDWRYTNPNETEVRRVIVGNMGSVYAGRFPPSGMTISSDKTVSLWTHDGDRWHVEKKLTPDNLKRIVSLA